MAQVTRKGNFFQDSGCVKSYMVEYRTFKYYSSSGNSRISKRESVSSSSQISPPLNPDLQTGYTITLPDDCNVYAIQIVAILARGTSAGTNIQTLVKIVDFTKAKDGYHHQSRGRNGKHFKRHQRFFFTSLFTKRLNLVAAVELFLSALLR